MSNFNSLVDVLAHRTGQHPDSTAVAVVSGEQSHRQALTFLELSMQAATLAERLVERTRPGDRAALIFPTCLEFVVAYFACLMARVIAVPLMPPRRNASHDSSAAILADSGSRIALAPGGDMKIHDGPMRERLAAAGIDLMPVSLAETRAAFPSLPVAGRDDLAFLQYTSGSTSTPRGVMVSHGNLLDNLEMIRVRFGNSAASTHVSWIPLYHDLGLIMNLLQPLFLGATSVLMLPNAFMHRPLNWLRAISSFGAEVAAAPNFAYDLCVDRFRAEDMQGIDLARWKIAVNGAEPVRASTLERFEATFRPYGFRPAASHPTYGLAEATLVVSGNARDVDARISAVSAAALKRGLVRAPECEPDNYRIVGCGTAMPGLTLAIVDPRSRRQCAPGSIGEIWVNGPSVATGYYGRSQESQDVFRARLASTAPSSGLDQSLTWLRTGDLGFLDGAGQLHITGRIKDVLIIRGVNHYPQDIEATAAQCHPALRRDHAAVFTVTDEHGIERVILVHEVERAQRSGLDEGAVVAAIRTAVVNNHDIGLHRVTLIRPGTIPMTTSGKIQRGLTRQRWLDGTLQLWHAPVRPAAPAVEAGGGE